MEIPELNAVNIEIIVDNFIDVFEASRPGQVERVILGRLKKPVMAAHGLSLLITLHQDQQQTRILMDTANSPLVLFNNLEALERPVDEVDAVFLSHGHPDHYGGLLELLNRRQKPLPVYLHPDCYYPKLLITPRGRIGPWTLERDKLEAAGAELHENTGPTLINGQALITGTVEASVPYETPLPGAKRIVQGQEEHDTFVDEQALVIKVAGKGLVVIGGCSHPGIVNMVKYAQKLTGVDHIAAVIGGFHLTAGGDQLINNTIQGLQEINPDLIFAGHCTGFRALTALATAFPENFMVSCVGTKLIIG
ncbi:MAG: MBL fold metallo-hydrolase [Deltaproteobacteria bacterium]|nr:MBL fold metallo-hydrolase [Deltaproteobacteria bacterium]MBW1952485.1 MBL fold metallo-hydrolase [Deltaproteobacteria bacterium]MBW1987336.1 MBL fold metallo-hydrolase [Deltaproteobacteria bacterium]MBW2135298.1 MBL fold metallo-hydrolase [Deltaproteobacteria bacterium]